jgi:hypothetical protein
LAINPSAVNTASRITVTVVDVVMLSSRLKIPAGHKPCRSVDEVELEGRVSATITFKHVRCGRFVTRLRTHKGHVTRDQRQVNADLAVLALVGFGWKQCA